MYSVQLLSPVWLFETPWNAACQVSLSITNYQRLLMSIESVMPFNHLNPLSSPSPPVFNLSQHQGFSYWGSLLHQVDKVLEFQLSINSSMNIQDWFPLGWTGWISLQSKELSRSSPTPQFKSINSSALSFFL